jgi:hypothetical protein
MGYIDRRPSRIVKSSCLGARWIAIDIFPVLIKTADAAESHGNKGQTDDKNNPDIFLHGTHIFLLAPLNIKK